MARRANPALVLQQKFQLIGNALQGRDSASSSNLAASFGLPVDEVRKLLSSKGVRDDG